MDERVPDQKNGSQARISALRFTDEERLLIWQRREKAAELHALGVSYAKIGRRLGISTRQAWRDVQAYFREAARYYRAPEFREQIAATYRWAIRAAAAEHDALPQTAAHSEARLRCIDRVHKSLDGLRALYGMMGENSFRLELPVSPATIGTPDAPRRWLDGVPPERLREVRGAMLELYRRLPRNAVPGSFAEEIARAEVVDEVPPAPPTGEAEAEPMAPGPVDAPGDDALGSAS